MKLNIQLFASAGVVVIDTELKTKNFDKQIEEVTYRLKELEYELNHKQELNLDKRTIKEYEVEVEKLQNQLVGLRKKQESIEKTGLVNIQNQLKGIGNSVKDVTKKVGRWALAIFGIRSAYMMVRQAMSTLSQYDSQLGANIEYIRYLLASTLKPVIEALVNLAYKLLTYINAISQAWFGVNLFAKASRKEFEKQQKAIGGSAKKAKELQRTLAGFDEMNIIQENGNVTPGGGGGGVGINTNLPDFEDVKIPSWMEWIIKHKDEVISAIAGIATALTLLRFGVTGIKALGIGIAVAGIIYSIKSLLKYLKDPTWKNFGKTIAGIGITVAGVGIAIGALPVALSGALITAYGIVVANWKKIKKFLQKGINWLTDKGTFIEKHFGKGARAIYDTIVGVLQPLLNYFDGYISSIKKYFDGLIKFIKGIFTKDWKLAWEGLKQIISSVWDNIKIKVQTVLDIIIGIVKGATNFIIGLWQDLFKAVTGIFTGIGDFIGNIFGGKVKKAFNSIVNWVKTNVIDKISKRFETLKKDINNFFNWLTGKESKHRMAGGGGSGSFGGGGSGGTRAKGGIFYPSKLPKLAVGGILNMPGPGVPYHGATIAEHGAEAVVPLTDSQQMTFLGEAIGRFVRIDNFIDVNMDSRKIKRIMATSNGRDRMVGNG